MHEPKFAGLISPSGLFGGCTTGFCSDGCLKAFEAAEKREKAAKAAAKAEQKRQDQLKRHENARKEAKEALETARKNVAKWQKKVERIESAIRSDDVGELESAATETTSWATCFIVLLLLVDVAAAVWYYYFR